MVKRVFEQGNVVRVNLEPVSGREMQSQSRPALVLTPGSFNRLGDVLVAPITQGGDFSRFAGFAVNLTGTGCKTQGAVLINKVRMMDLQARQAKKIETVPDYVLEEAVGRLCALLQND